MMIAQNPTNRQTESDGLRCPQHKELITWSTSSWQEGLYALSICSSDLQCSDTVSGTFCLSPSSYQGHVTRLEGGRGDLRNLYV